MGTEWVLCLSVPRITEHNSCLLHSLIVIASCKTRISRQPLPVLLPQLDFIAFLPTVKMAINPSINFISVILGSCLF